MDRRRPWGTVRWAALTSAALVSTAWVTGAAVDLTIDHDPTHLDVPVVDPFDGWVPADTTVTTLFTAPTTPTTVPPDRITVGELPGAYTRVVAGSFGIDVADPSGVLPIRRVSHRSIDVAYGIDDGIVVAQEEQGSEWLGAILVIDRQGVHELAPTFEGHGEGASGLLDAGYVGGRPYALVESAGPDTGGDHDVRVALVDLLTFRPTDLGTIGGWEEWASDGRVLPNGEVVLLMAGTGGSHVERRRVDGSTAWSVALREDDEFRIALDGDEVVVLTPSWADDVDDHPSLDVQRLDLATGAERAARTHLRLQPADDVDLEGGGSFCYLAEVVDGDLLCDGPAIVRIDLDRRTMAREPHAPEHGTMTTWRTAP